MILTGFDKGDGHAMRKNGKGLIIFILLILILAVILFLFLNKSPKHLARNTVEAFYSFEQEGAYSDSWAMFHPWMQEKFPKGEYLQDRPHVFMNHFGVTTFTYTIDAVSEIENWKMDDEAEPIDLVYCVTVLQVFKGKYGNFTIVQDVFVTEFDNGWKVLWDYNE